IRLLPGPHVRGEVVDDQRGPDAERAVGRLDGPRRLLTLPAAGRAPAADAGDDDGAAPSGCRAVVRGTSGETARGRTAVRRRRPRAASSSWTDPAGCRGPSSS